MGSSQQPTGLSLELTVLRNFLPVAKAAAEHLPAVVMGERPTDGHGMPAEAKLKVGPVVVVVVIVVVVVVVGLVAHTAEAQSWKRNLPAGPKPAPACANLPLS